MVKTDSVIEIVCNTCAMGNGDCYCDIDWAVANVIELPNCDICEANQITKKALYDTAIYGVKEYGPIWGFVCQECFIEFGCKLGLGKGQRLVVTK